MERFWRGSGALLGQAGGSRAGVPAPLTSHSPQQLSPDSQSVLWELGVQGDPRLAHCCCLFLPFLAAGGGSRPPGRASTQPRLLPAAQEHSPRALMWRCAAPPALPKGHGDTSEAITEMTG